MERLWSIAIDRTRDPLIGMHMAEAYSPGALDILGYVVLSCATVGEVLDRLARYARILNNGMRIHVERDGRMAICRCIFIESTDNYLLRNPEQAVDSMWVGLARELRRLTATPLLASEVWFRRPAPPAKARSEYERVFASRLTLPYWPEWTSRDRSRNSSRRCSRQNSRALRRRLASPGQVGFLLGFSEPSAFHRAFRRWTGKRPSEYRA